MPQPVPTYSLALTRGNLLTALVLSLAAAGGLAGVAAEKGSFQPQATAGVNYDKVEMANQKIDPNTATVVSLRRLYRMGPKLAEAVVQYRREHAAAKGGRAFVFAEDLEAVKGIGPEMAGAYREHMSLPSAEE